MKEGCKRRAPSGDTEVPPVREERKDEEDAGRREEIR
jgi:hypothetical protein